MIDKIIPLITVVIPVYRVEKYLEIIMDLRIIARM